MVAAKSRKKPRFTGAGPIEAPVAQKCAGLSRGKDVRDVSFFPLRKRGKFPWLSG